MDLAELPSWAGAEARRHGRQLEAEALALLLLLHDGGHLFMDGGDSARDWWGASARGEASRSGLKEQISPAAAFRAGGDETSGVVEIGAERG